MTQNDQNNLDILAYLRGELSGEELKTIEALIAADANFAADVEFQRTLRQTLQDSEQTEPASEFGWARLSKAIDDEAEAQADTDILPAANDRQKPIQFWKYAALFLACAMFGQTYLMASTKSDANDKYFMASEIEVQPHFTMKPSASLTVSTLTEVLVQHNGLITMGPDENGQYEVSFQTLEACDATVKALENSSELFQTTKACEEG